jgi:hypothetical protein
VPVHWCENVGEYRRRALPNAVVGVNRDDERKLAKAVRCAAPGGSNCLIKRNSWHAIQDTLTTLNHNGANVAVWPLRSGFTAIKLCIYVCAASFSPEMRTAFYMIQISLSRGRDGQILGQHGKWKTPSEGFAIFF